MGLRPTAAKAFQLLPVLSHFGLQQFDAASMLNHLQSSHWFYDAMMGHRGAELAEGSLKKLFILS
jgi:hypothetical protein